MQKVAENPSKIRELRDNLTEFWCFPQPKILRFIPRKSDQEADEKLRESRPIYYASAARKRNLNVL